MVSFCSQIITTRFIQREAALSEIIKRCANYFSCPLSGSQRIKWVAFCTFAFALVANLYCWTNSMFSHDSLMVIQHDWALETSLGRFLQEYYVSLRGNVVAPFLIGMLGTVYLAASISLIASLFDIKARGSIIAICGLIVINASITLLNATYIDWFDIYMLSFLFSILSIYVTARYKWGFLSGMLFLILSEGLYQSYINVAVFLALLYGVYCLLKDQKTSEVICNEVKLVLTIVFGTLLYYLVTSLVQNATGNTDLGNYNSISSVSIFNSDQDLLGLILQTWVRPFEYFMYPETYAPYVSAIINLLLFFLGAFSLLFLIYKKHLSIKHVILIVVMALLMPFGINLIFFLSSGMTHSLMIHSYYLWYVGVFALSGLILNHNERCEEQSKNPPPCEINPIEGTSSKQFSETRNSAYCHLAIVLLAFALIFSNIVYANQVYLKKELEYQGTLSVMTRVLDRIETTEGYVPGETPVAFIGNINDNSIFTSVREGFPPAKDQYFFEDGKYTGYSVGLGTGTAIYGSPQLERYFSNILGYRINIVDNPGADAHYIDKQMPAFPEKGCMRWVDGVLVVKLSIF